MKCKENPRLWRHRNDLHFFLSWHFYPSLCIPHNFAILPPQHIGMCAHTHAYTHTHTYVHIHTYTSARTELQRHAYRWPCTCSHAFTYKLTHMYTYTHLLTHTSLQMHMHGIRACTESHSCLFIGLQTYMHGNTHVHRIFNPQHLFSQLWEKHWEGGAVMETTRWCSFNNKSSTVCLRAWSLGRQWRIHFPSSWHRNNVQCM